MDEGFEVRLHRSGRTIAIAPDKTILSTLLDAGVDANYHCTMGGCGTCETTILEGTPDHRENDQRDPPQQVNSEAEARQDDGEKKNEQDDHHDEILPLNAVSTCHRLVPG
jgi:ferredoxin